MKKLFEKADNYLIKGQLSFFELLLRLCVGYITTIKFHYFFLIPILKNIALFCDKYFSLF